MKITVGCDPELFVKQDNKFRCAWGLIPGTKEEPHRVNNGAVQVDGFALEYNIDPVDNADDFVNYNLEVLDQMKAMVPGYEFAIVPSARFNGNHFRAQPDEAKVLGCTPDYNAYTMEENPIPDNNTTLRTAGGHIHIGFCEGADPQDDEHILRCATLVKQLDVYLGLPSVLFDTDKDRRAMYGKAGAFRAKPYGVEYRSLSNAWVVNEQRMRFVFKQTVKAVEDLVAGIRPIDRIGDIPIQNTINRSSSRDAAALLGNYVKDGRAIREEAKALLVN